MSQAETNDVCEATTRQSEKSSSVEEPHVPQTHERALSAASCSSVCLVLVTVPAAVAHL